jgi:hypothetical protein
VGGGKGGEMEGGWDLPIAFPVAHAMKFAAITTLFFVWPATFRESILMLNVWAAQKLRTM